MNSRTPQQISVSPARSCSDTASFDHQAQDGLDNKFAEVDAIEAHLPVLLSGLRWLYDTPQPDTAILHHHGQRLPSVGNRHLDFTPVGWAGRVIIVLSVSHVDLGERWPARNPLRTDELDQLADLLDGMGETVVHRWNGNPHISGSIALARRAHPTLDAAVRRYHAGCPDHGGSVFCRCSWYSTGYRTVTTVHDVHRQARQHASNAAPLTGPWPEYLDPTGQLAAIANVSITAHDQKEACA